MRFARAAAVMSAAVLVPAGQQPPASGTSMENGLRLAIEDTREAAGPVGGRS